MPDDLRDALDIYDSDRNAGQIKETIKLSAESQGRLLKWYTGNPFERRPEFVHKALGILAWCQDSSELYYCTPVMRRSMLEDAAVSFSEPLERLTRLVATSESVFASATTPKLIAFEGIDGSGKTHQMRRLQSFLEHKNAKVTVLSYPDYQEFFGRELASLLGGTDAVRADHLDPKSMALWYASDRKSSVPRIYDQPPNTFVLLNRYTLSSAVYQSVRSDLDLTDWIFELEHAQMEIPAPDVYIVFDVSPTVSQGNVSQRRRREGNAAGLDVYEQSMSLLVAARERYRDLAARLPGIELIECMADEHTMKPADQIHTEVISCLRRRNLLSMIR